MPTCLNTPILGPRRPAPDSRVLSIFRDGSTGTAQGETCEYEGMSNKGSRVMQMHDAS